MKEYKYNWCGGLRTLEDPHFAIFGTPGGGKSLTTSMLEDSVLGPGPRPRVHATIYDAKLELYPYLCQIFDSDAIHLLHCFDKRAVRWAIKRDVHNAPRALQVASAFIPKTGEEKNPYFRAQARAFVTEAMNSLRLRELDWTLNDLLQACSDPETLHALWKAHPNTEFMAVREGAVESTKDIHSTIDSVFAQLVYAASASARSSNRWFSARRWLKEPPSIVLLPYDSTYDEALGPVNRAIFQYLVDEILHQPKGREVETWTFFDEARLAGRMPGLVDLMRTGRSKRNHTVLGIQDVAGLIDVHGESVAKELLGLCGNKLFLRLTEPSTAKYASECFGSAAVEETTVSDGVTKGGKSKSRTTTENRAPKDAKVILESEFLRLRSPSKELRQGYTGFVLPPLPRSGSDEPDRAQPRYGLNHKYRVRVDGAYLDEHLRPEPSPKFLEECPAYAQVDDQDMERLVWTEEQRRYFLEPRDDGPFESMGVQQL